jgi:transcriptional regulator with XRE-family HTH domain
LSDGTTQDDRSASDRVIAGLALRTLRSRMGLKQSEVAVRAGTHAHYISQIENGHRRVSWETIVRLLRAIDVAPRDFAIEVEAHEHTAQQSKHDRRGAIKH